MHVRNKELKVLTYNESLLVRTGNKQDHLKIIS
jgi:hypothetical protein